jgi:ATP synthase protein I
MAPAGDRSAWREVSQYAFVGTTFVMCVVVGLAGGYLLDRWLGTEPWLLLVGLAFGIAAGFWNFYRAIRALSRLDEGDGQTRPDDSRDR